MKLIPIVNFDTSIKLLGNLTAMYRARVFKSKVSAQQTCAALFSTIVTQSILFHSLKCVFHDSIMNLLSSSVIVNITLKVNNNLISIRRETIAAKSQGKSKFISV